MNRSKRLFFFLGLVIHIIGIQFSAEAQNELNDQIEKAVAGMSLREIGPALMGGRISDIAIHPDRPSTWYVSAGSGNLWKTTNRGTTWTPIFDHQPSYSIGTVTIDPNNPDVIWVGTGENVSGRHVGWGDGIYKSADGGKTWANMGLQKSEHIGKILIDPRDSDVILVAAEGPLWSGGGERGLYKSVDGGATWNAVLTVDQYTGVTDIEFAPSNPDVVYAATYQRFRRTWTLMAGGPNSGIYKSEDNGDTWTEKTTGLPRGDMGKIGLAVTAADPSRVYATIEANDAEKGFYRSTDRGESWAKQNSYISGGTGPHYYQEIEASQVNPDLVYQMDVFLHVTRDGGKTMDYLTSGRTKHSDNHALWIDPTDGNHLIAGTDGGLYETYDEGVTWQHFQNLPISQFYKLGLDNSEPFYNVVAGAQDLGTLIGPSRTTNTEGIRNQDWYVPLGADGYGSVYDWADNNTAYMMWQEGSLTRLNVSTGETMGIKPDDIDSEVPERWNWDSPLLVSPHNHERIYFGSQRLWRSDNRGDDWQAISGDLTTNTNRYTLELMDRVWSTDDLYDNGAMSKYATLTTISESPLVEGLLYTGSDDGLVHVSEDGGANWRKSNLEIPARAFINDIEASTLNENTVFVVVDAHKLGDYAPYVMMSTDRGKRWRSISGDLPAGTIVWSIKQDHVEENLLFIGTDFGIYFSYNMGTNWVKLSAGVPTIPFRDLAIQQRDKDLVGASFGRGIYVLDDYSPLRTLSAVAKAKEPAIFPVRDAWWYVPSIPMQAKGMPGQGSSAFVTPNPDFGATISYYVGETATNSRTDREAREQQVRESGGDTPFPSYDQLNAERQELAPQVLLLIKDAEGNPIRWLQGQNKAGLHRIAWDLRYPAPDPIRLTKPAFQPPWAGDPEGPLVAPGTYAVELFLENNGELTQQGDPQRFEVKPIPALEATDFGAVSAFQKATWEMMVKVSTAGQQLSEARERLRFLQVALKQTPRATQAHFATWSELNARVAELSATLYGDPARGSLDESTVPGIYGRVASVSYGHWQTTQQPTETYRRSLAWATEQYTALAPELEKLLSDLAAFEASMKAIGAPYTRGSRD